MEDVELSKDHVLTPEFLALNKNEFEMMEAILGWIRKPKLEEDAKLGWDICSLNFGHL